MIIEGMTAIKGALDIVHGVKSLTPKNGDADAALALSELKVSLAKANTAMAEAIQENNTLRAELSALKKIVEGTSSRPTLSNDGTYRFDGEGGDFCTTCYDGEGKKIRVTEFHGAFRAFGKFKCERCKGTFGEG